MTGLKLDGVSWSKCHLRDEQTVSFKSICFCIHDVPRQSEYSTCLINVQDVLELPKLAELYNDCRL